jgi:two-component SAPR family response regulator
MLNAIVIDDEKPAIDVLQIFLEKTGEIVVQDRFLSAKEALIKIEERTSDVIFLDIEMPEMSGLEFAGKMMDVGKDIPIIFVTAYNKYAIEAFHVNAIDYLLKPISSEEIERILPKLKKDRLKKKVEFSDTNSAQIYCFKRLQVYGEGSTNLMKWRTSKAEELFAFLLQNLNKAVPKWKIMEVIWPECETDKINVYLHTTIYKIKRTLLAGNIKFSLIFTNGCYKLELSDIYIDTVAFQKITKDKIEITEESIKKYEKALLLYQGHYLEEHEYRWSQSKREKYSRIYRDLVLAFFTYYIRIKDYGKAERILQNALVKAPFEDDLNEKLMKLYFMNRDKTSLITHYQKINELYQVELGILPGKELQDLYHRANKL